MIMENIKIGLVGGIKVDLLCKKTEDVLRIVFERVLINLLTIPSSYNLARGTTYLLIGIWRR